MSMYVVEIKSLLLNFLEYSFAFGSLSVLNTDNNESKHLYTVSPALLAHLSGRLTR